MLKVDLDPPRTRNQITGSHNRLDALFPLRKSNMVDWRSNVVTPAFDECKAPPPAMWIFGYSQVLRYIIGSKAAFWVSPSVNERIDHIAWVALNHDKVGVWEKVKEGPNA